MASIDLQDVTVDFPVYNARGRSLKNDLLRRVGGAITRDADTVTVRALDSVTLGLRSGDRLAIVGHNGAGKSTLLRVLSGAYEPSHGRSRIEGRISSLLDLTMGMDLELSGRENIVLRGIFLGMNFQEARALVPQIEDASELGGYIDLPIRTYSSGMILRLAFEVSTAIQPDIMLMDEMISVGDAAFAAKSREKIERMMAKSRILVLASHSEATLLRYCTKAIRLRQGRVVAAGDIGAVLSTEEPA